ncbi:MAG: MBL fold metallo-hydrolase [Deltaproteobacteria bacterium]|nr:MBL fold metallo-hydrolase [Deltaproteobacteria bacterium]
MAVTFQSLRSGSNGNCLQLWTARTRLLVDCGWESTRACRRALALAPAGAPPAIDAVFLTHLHGDHLSAAAIRALSDLRLPVYCHQSCLEEASRLSAPLRLRPFTDAPVPIGDLEVTPTRVRHSPRVVTHAFSVRSPADERRVVIATDLSTWDGLLHLFLDADFIFVESNHDVRLARQRPVPNSRHHLSNDQTAALLCQVLRQSRRPPAGVMLAHLSAERNAPELARACVEAALRRAGLWEAAPPLWLAPRRAGSVTVTLAARGRAAAARTPAATSDQLPLFGRGDRGHGP